MDNLSIATTHANLARALENIGEPAKARHHFEQALLIRHRVYGSNEHLDIADILEDLADVLHELGDEKQTSERMREAEEIRERLGRPRANVSRKLWSSEEAGLTKDDISID